MADTVLKIAAGAWEMHSLPALAGAILSLRFGDRDILRPSPRLVAGPLDTACFPLVPYANRIAHGRFRFDRRAIQLPRNFGDHPHSLHGVGWQARWYPIEIDADRLVLRHVHHADASWPWDYGATQTFLLSDAGLSATLALTNTDGFAMPAGVGFHPYFSVTPESQLRLETGDLWLSDAEQLPTYRAGADEVQDWSDGARVVRSVLVDHCYPEWNGQAVLTSGSYRTRISADGARFVHIHIPPGTDFVGIEPVSHMPDAVNRPESVGQTGLTTLMPGETSRVTMRISAD